ncbi:MAG: hypothetical protein WAT61_01850 [Flavobacteriales bacterium]
MNRLFHLGFVLAFATAASTLAAQDSAKDVVEVVFTQDMDQADLDSIQQAMKPLGVDLQINNTKFEAGLLHTIDFSITTGTGDGSARGQIRPDRKFGFICSPKGGTQFAVVAGELGPAPAPSLVSQDNPKELVEVVFTQDMDQADLDSIQLAVKPLGVDLQINSTEYEDGLLHTLDFSIATSKGNGTAKGDIQPDRKFGFRYYPNGGGKFAVLVGRLDTPGREN